MDGGLEPYCKSGLVLEIRRADYCWRQGGGNRQNPVNEQNHEML
jgi:hypothetical protein